MSITDNVKNIKKEIPSDVDLIAATKTRSVEEIKQAVSAGVKIIGENYVQEAEEKLNYLENAEFHCIGHLQTNKVKKAVDIFDMIQTVDSLKLAKEIDKRCKEIGKLMPILIEVNSGKEENKEGVMPKDVVKLVKEVSSLKNVKVMGLMTIAPYFDDPKKARPYFKLVKDLFDEIKSMQMDNVDMKILSMGMSDSYKIAIEEGSNMIRIGTGIFGRRS